MSPGNDQRNPSKLPPSRRYFYKDTKQSLTKIWLEICQFTSIATTQIEARIPVCFLAPNI